MATGPSQTVVPVADQDRAALDYFAAEEAFRAARERVEAICEPGVPFIHPGRQEVLMVGRDGKSGKAKGRFLGTS